MKEREQGEKEFSRELAWSEGRVPGERAREPAWCALVRYLLMRFLRRGGSNGRGRLRGRCWRRVGSSGDGGEDFGDGVFAGFAIAVVDAALRERVAAAAGAGFRVEFVECNGFLFRRELGKIDAGKFRGAVGVFQKNLAGVLEGFHFDVADGQAEERTNFGFIENRIAEAFVLLHDTAFGIENEGSGERGDSAVLKTNLVGSERDGIVDAKSCGEFLDGVQILIVHDQAENLQAVFIFLLQFDEVGNFGAARPAPGGPEIYEDDFTFGIGERDGLAVEAGQLEFGRRIGIADEADGGLVVLLRSRKERKEAKK